MKKDLIDEAVSLLNRSEHLEALKCLREHLGIINGFQCKECNVITSSTTNFTCIYCGSSVKTIVYRIKD